MDVTMENEGWKRITRRKRRRISERNSGRNGCKENEIVSFYFSEIPETHGAKEMFRIFKL